MSQKTATEKSNLLNRIEEMTFEDALKELENIVRKLETGKETLESAIENYEYGNALREHCEKKLKEAKLKVEKITKVGNNEVETVAFETQ